MQTAYLLAWIGALAWPALVAFAVWRWLKRRRAPGPWAWLGLLGATTVWALGVWAFLWEPETLVVRRIEVVSQAWKGPPLRIGVIADTHIGAPHMGPARMKRLVARMNSEHPDMVALLGDYVGGHAPAGARGAGARAAILAGLRQLAGLAPPLGTYAVLGDDDWRYDAETVAAALREAGAHVLRNEAARAPRDPGAFWVIGLTDHEASLAPSYTQSLIGVPAREPVIALEHRPDKFVAAPDQVALTLAGHTHCGQARIPLIGRLLPGASEESRRWPCGLYEEHGRRLYVSGGVGVSLIPARFLQPPEIAILTLRPDPGQIRALAPAPAPTAPPAP